MSEKIETIEQKLHLISLTANLAGAALTFLFFSTIMPLPTGQASVRSLRPADLLLFVGPLVVIFALTSAWSNRYTQRLRKWYRALQGAVPPAELPPNVASQALGFAPRIALLSFAAWTAAGLFYAIVNWLSYSISMLTILIGIVGVGGVLTTAIVYFSADLVWRRAIPVFFPDGRLSAVPAVRLSVQGRLLIVFLLIGLWPLAMLTALSLQRAHALVGAPNPRAILDNLLILELFILAVSVLASVGMAVFVTRSIVGPLRALQAAMGRVEQQDFAARVPVTTNDELGYLSERFNQMTGGLRQGELVRNLLNLYVSPEVAREAVERGARLGGELVECSVLFSDIRNFTGLAEALPPADLIALLNRYMGAMVGVVVAEGGMVNKFGGDSLLAIFGTPLNPAADHAARAVRAALAMRRALAEFNQTQPPGSTSDPLRNGGQGVRSPPASPLSAPERRPGGEVRPPSPLSAPERRPGGEVPPLRIGIGIATGPVVAGNVGGAHRIEYTVIGDTVNLASRLQDKTKELGCDILVSAETYTRASRGEPGVRPALDAELLPGLAVRGKREPVDAYVVRSALR
ncbi:MAG: HAMP domain-containing protein [Chloroflexi bacterium]|nr:HAMP domain-containing protein [Chloroflexota bacterium]